MIPGIVASSRPINNSASSLVPGQVATRVGSGTLSLPNAPIPGNLVVVLALFNLTLDTDQHIAGFARVGGYLGSGNGLLIAGFSRIARSGDGASVTFPGAGLAAIYEFQNAAALVPIAGGFLDQFLSGVDYTFPSCTSPFGPDDILVGAAGHLRNTPFANTAASGLTTDLSTTTTNTGGCIFRLSNPPPALISGTMTGETVTSAPTFGHFAIIAQSTLE